MASALERLTLLRSGQLKGCTELSLCDAGLEQFPREIFNLGDSLVKLDLSRNKISELPKDIHKLCNLRILFCSSNCFTVFPEGLGQCPDLSMIAFKQNAIRTIPEGSLPPKLRWLILTDNKIEALPYDIGKCQHLQKLMLAGNCLMALPDSLRECVALGLIRISANKFHVFPQVLSSLPNLAWLAFAGNQFSDVEASRRFSQKEAIRLIDWSELVLHEKLGEGASGVIYRGEWTRSGTGVLKTAIKLFKGAVTSDGWPHNEMEASLCAERHLNLIPVLGKITGHPTNAEGLVFDLIDPTFTNLAGPPDMTTCTRDVYLPQTAFTVNEILRCARGIASAVAHLHSHGVVHGDLYGHNILISATGECLLGDFGAASLFDKEDINVSRVVQTLEARAFGHLLEELLTRTRETGAEDAKRIEKLWLVQKQCVHPDIFFLDICSQLDTLV
ncbi:hypothetical protein PhCBS80983_g06384 [Powellomyces hirtus]|uniref:Protein kinase domain-containing protein n=1 Tax=Powellomyces hirtus TaxID=109895 RepID=A0A507DP11_9FUNG|nr:hypothetical protein PhCBS80983_g06384 [Powellomyces hirtus]